MDIGWAVAAMKNGEKVKRRVWDELRHIPAECMYLELVRPAPGWRETVVVVSYDGSVQAYSPSNEQLLAEDWERV